MNIVEFFVRFNLRRKIANCRESIHDIDERVAELNEYLGVWTGTSLINGGGVTQSTIQDIASWRGERSKLLLRKKKIEKELDLLELTLTQEYRKARSV